MPETKNTVSRETEASPTGWQHAQFQTHVAETGDQIVFDTIGDTFTGIYTGYEIGCKDGGTEADEFTVLQFRGEDGKPYQTNAGWKLRKAFVNRVDSGSLVRITYVKDVATNSVQPMKDFRVEIAR